MRAKFLKDTPLMEGDLTITLTIPKESMSKAIAHELVDMRGEWVEISLPKEADTPDAQFIAWQRAQLTREIAIRQDMIERIEPYKVDGMPVEPTLLEEGKG